MRHTFYITGTLLVFALFCNPVFSQQKSGADGSARRQQEQDGPAKSGNQESQKQKKSKGQTQQQSTDSSQVAANQQQAAAAAALAAYLSSPRRQRLGRIPRMFGDWFGPGLRITSLSETPGPTNGIFTSIDLPQVVRVGKISENNSAIPYDRVFFNYNYFNNVGVNAALGPITQSSVGGSNVSRYTIGLERTYFDGQASLEARFVMGDSTDFGHNPAGTGPLGFQTFSPTAGNLSLISKVLLYEDESTALATGLGIEFPTGGDSQVQSGSSILEIRNNAPFLSPYIGLLKNPVGSPWFANAFLQVEVPIWGDRVFATETANGGTVSLGRYTPQTAIFVDVGIGRWLLQNPGGLVSGVAGFLEMHYNAALNDADRFGGTVSTGPLSSTFTLNPGIGKYEVFDITSGLHFELGQQTKLRIGGVIPIGSDRPFDSEFGIQWTRYR